MNAPSQAPTPLDAPNAQREPAFIGIVNRANANADQATKLADRAEGVAGRLLGAEPEPNARTDAQDSAAPETFVDRVREAQHATNGALVRLERHLMRLEEEIGE